MKISDFSDDLVTPSTQVDLSRTGKFAALRYAQTLASLLVDKLQFASLEEDIIQGRVATEQAIIKCLAECREIAAQRMIREAS